MAIFESPLVFLPPVFYDQILTHRIGCTNVGAIIYVGSILKIADKYQRLFAQRNGLLSIDS
jgi:hypothetical protein